MGQTRAQCHNKQQGCIFGFFYIYLFMYMITDLPILDDAVRGARSHIQSIPKTGFSLVWTVENNRSRLA